MSAYLYEESAKQLQQRRNALEILADEYDGYGFEIRMLTGAETMDVESQLRAKAREMGVEPDEVGHYRKQLVVDAATVAAPEGFPTDDDGPKPSAAGNPLTYALYEQVERLNNAGATDFRAPGFDDRDVSPPASSATPSTSGSSSVSSPREESDTPPSSTDS